MINLFQTLRVQFSRRKFCFIYALQFWLCCTLLVGTFLFVAAYSALYKHCTQRFLNHAKPI